MSLATGETDDPMDACAMSRSCVQGCAEVLARLDFAVARIEPKGGRERGGLKRIFGVHFRACIFALAFLSVERRTHAGRS